MKFGGKGQYQIVRRHQAIGNLAPGFWYDIHQKFIAMEDFTVVENDGPGLFLELSQGPFFARRILSAGNTNNQLRVMCVGESQVEDSIFYGNNPALPEKNGSVTTAIAQTSFWIRASDHAQQDSYIPTSYVTRNCVFLGGRSRRSILQSPTE